MSFPSRLPLDSLAVLKTLVIKVHDDRLSGPNLLSIFMYFLHVPDLSAAVANVRTLLIEVGGQAVSCDVLFSLVEGGMQSKTWQHG